jgi:putative peptidoglycan lipid II flippase
VEAPVAASGLSRLLGIFSLKRKHSAGSATLLLMFSSVGSSVLGLVRQKYISHTFGVSHLTDAYNGAFYLPDMISYFLVGGVASITLVSMLSRYREADDDAGGDEALSAVLMAMLVVLGTGVVLAEIFAGAYVRAVFNNFDAETAERCTRLTRIMLPAQLFFFAGGVLGSRLLVRKVFLFQAMTPLIYNLGIILGGVFLTRALGIESLAWGVFAGALIGSLAINAWGALRSGLRLTPKVNLRHPAFLEWLSLSLPLMVGVSLAMADKWISGHFAAADPGAITLLNAAKILFNAPLGAIGLAAGAASLPFFSSLYAQRREYDFNAAVCRSVSRLMAISLLVSAWLIALAVPFTDLLQRGGKFSRASSQDVAFYLAIYSISFFLWSAQGIYARAFYAARNTMTPAISGTVVTLVSIPIYGLLFHRMGVIGLVVASDVGIFLHTAALAGLLHRARLVSIATLDYAELGRALVASLLALVMTQQLVTRIPSHNYMQDVLILVVGTLLWAGTSAAILRLTGSQLLSQIRRKT